MNSGWGKDNFYEALFVKINKREARKLFEHGATIYCYPKCAKTEYDYLADKQCSPIPIRKYEPDITFEHELEIARICRCDSWFGVMKTNK